MFVVLSKTRAGAVGSAVDGFHSSPIPLLLRPAVLINRIIFSHLFLSRPEREHPGCETHDRHSRL